VREVAGLRAVGIIAAIGSNGAAREDVLDQDGSGRSAVAFPQFVTVHAVVGREEQRAVDVREVVGWKAVGIIAAVVSDVPARVDVLDERRAGGGAVALPELEAVRVVSAREEQCPVDVREVVWGKTVAAYEAGAGGGAVALPEPPT